MSVGGRAVRTRGTRPDGAETAATRHPRPGPDRQGRARLAFPSADTAAREDRAMARFRAIETDGPVHRFDGTERPITAVAGRREGRWVAERGP